MIVVCKKWHVAKRLLERIKQTTNVPAIEYVFDEAEAPLPDLGGIQSTITKRTRHRRALMRMLFDYYGTDRMLVCIDPSNLDLLQDFSSDRSVTRILEVNCTFDEEYLVGHAVRVGLAGEQTSQETFDRLLPTIRNDMVFESDRIRDAEFDNLTRISETADTAENSKALASFLTVPQATAWDIVAGDGLFSD